MCVGICLREIFLCLYMQEQVTVFNTFACFLHSRLTFICAATKLLPFLVLDKIQRPTTNWQYNPYQPFSYPAELGLVQSGGEAVKGAAWAGPNCILWVKGTLRVMLECCWRVGLAAPFSSWRSSIPGADLPPQGSGSRCEQQPAHSGGSDTRLAGKEEGVFKGGGLQPDNCSWVALPLFEM